MSKTTKASPAIGKLIKVCPGGKHAWYETGIGKVRKPYKGENWKKE